MTAGQSAGPRETPFMPMWRSRRGYATRLREQDGRQLASPGDRHVVRRAPCLEELQELLSRAVLVPIAVPAHDLDELIERLLALAARVERDGEIEARLM